MRIRIRAIAAGIIMAAVLFPVWSQDQGPTAAQVLAQVDDVLYAMNDKEMTIRFTLIDKSGRESVREMYLLEKGAFRRLMKFLAPADQKGIGFLSLPNDVMYFYLPAFGKSRRIAGHVKNQRFAGSDFSYENLEARRYAECWDPSFVKKDSVSYVLRLAPKTGTITEYSKLLVTIRADNLYPVKVEYFDKAGAAYKTLTREKVEKIGAYWESKYMTMEDLKTGHKTRLEVLSVKHDANVADDRFSQRYLEQ